MAIRNEIEQRDARLQREAGRGRVAALFGAGAGFTGVGGGDSGYTGVGAGDGFTGVGAGDGFTGVGAGDGFTGVGANSQLAGNGGTPLSTAQDATASVLVIVPMPMAGGLLMSRRMY